ncbi:MAG: cell envelope integrity protein CreD [Leptospira sp.]|nr:cell envelope integrity protein CreD [Leptospira sp.]
MDRLKNSNALRIVLLGILLLVLLFPVFLVEDLVHERMNRSQEAGREMSSKWGNQQNISGPFVAVPYSILAKRSDPQSGKIINQEEIVEAFFLPENLEIHSELESEIRKRGIFSTVLYQSKTSLSGFFPSILDSDFPKNTIQIFWQDSKLVVGISDTNGIGKDLKLNWKGKEQSFQPGTNSRGFSSGIHLPLKQSKNDLASPKQEFNIELRVKGSRSIDFAPIGKSSKISMQSNWGDPSFIGSALPTKRDISDNNFSATWETSYFSRNYPQVIQNINSGYVDTILQSSFGATLFQKVDQYQLVSRSLKYAIIVILFSFTVFFLMETLSSLKLHPIQYGLIGCAMVVFYVLNLSLSEQMDFWISYIIASIATSALIGYYSSHILNNKNKGFVSFGYFLFLYGFIYITLSAEDYALLLGSLAIFILLGLVMHFTRKMDWFENQGKE